MIGEPSPLVVAHFQCADDKFCPHTNPDGKINFGTAENHLMDAEILAMVNRPTPFSAEHLHYGELHGTPSFRAAIADLLEEDLKISAVNPDNIVVASGSSAILESIAMALFEDGDGLIVPAPFYTGFTHDFSTRFNVKLLPYGLSANNNYALDVDGLETAVFQAKEAGIAVKAILICSPNNPLGITYTDETLEQIVQLAKAHNLDIIADEIYAQSVYSGQYKSMLEIGKTYRQHIHFVYGFAKDFALSGFKTGLFYSENKELVTAVQEIAYFHAVSTHTQRFLETLIADRHWRNAFIKENKSRLLAAYSMTKRLFAEHLDVSIIEANAGIFVWADFSDYLQEQTFEAELALFDKIFNECDLSITPGQFFHADRPGWFRVCFAQDEAHIETAVMRLKNGLLSES